jgi:hypothetical protein
MFHNMTDIKAAIIGGISSILGFNIIGVAQDALLAFIFGGIGALGGWLVNKLLKRIEDKRGKKKI